MSTTTTTNTTTSTTTGTTTTTTTTTTSFRFCLNGLLCWVTLGNACAPNAEPSRTVAEGI